MLTQLSTEYGTLLKEKSVAVQADCFQRPKYSPSVRRGTKKTGIRQNSISS